MAGNRWTSALLLVSCIAIQPVRSQAGSSGFDQTWWIAMGIGISIPMGITGGVSINHELESGKAIQLSLNGAAELTLFQEPNTLNALAFGYGLTNRDHIGRELFVIGPAIVWGQEKESLKATKFITAGIAANAQFLHSSSFGLDFFGNANNKNSMCGMRLAIASGW